MRLFTTLSFLLFFLLLFTPSAFAVVTLDASLSWDIWQDLNDDGVQSTGEEINLANQSINWQANGSYSNSLGVSTSLNPSDPSIGYISGGNVPVSTLSEAFAVTGGSGTAQSTLTGEADGSGVNVSTSAAMPTGTAGATYDYVSLTTYANNIAFENHMFNSGTDGAWTTDDASIHFSLDIEYSIFDQGANVWAQNVELQGGSIKVNRRAFGYADLNGDGTYSFETIEAPQTWSFRLDTTGNDDGDVLTQRLLADFEFNPAQAGEVWSSFGWVFELDTNVWASYYQPEIVTPPVPDPIPEPSTILLLASGIAGLAWYGRKRKKA